MVTVTIPEPVLPARRSERYIEPVVEALVAAQLGSAGGSAGTGMGRPREIAYIDFTLELVSLVGIALVTRVLEECGASQGSRLAYLLDGKRVEVPFGTAQAVVVFIDTSDLEALAGTTPDDIVHAIDHVLPGAARYGQPCGSEYGLYFYGEDAAEMFAVMLPVLRASQLGGKVRVVLRHGGIDPREIAIE